MTDERARLLAERWKQDSLALGVRLIELRDKAADSGLTPEEELEYGRVEMENRRLFREFLRELFQKGRGPDDDRGWMSA